MKPCSSSTVCCASPTSPISPPTETVIPAGSRSRMKRVSSAVWRALSVCCSSTVGRSRVDDRRGVDVDVVVAGGDRLAGQVAHRLQLGLRVLLVLLGVDLVVVALDEDRSLVPLLDRGGEGVAGVLGRSLLGVAHLRAGQLEEDDLAVVGAGGAEDRPHHVVGEPADVDRRGGGVGVLAAPAGQVELVDRGREGAEAGRRGADQPAAGLLRRRLAEDRGDDQPVDQAGAETGRIVDRHPVTRDRGDPVERAEQLPNVRERVRGRGRRRHRLPPLPLGTGGSAPAPSRTAQRTKVVGTTTPRGRRVATAHGGGVRDEWRVVGGSFPRDSY